MRFLREHTSAPKPSAPVTHVPGSGIGTMEKLSGWIVPRPSLSPYCSLKSVGLIVAVCAPISLNCWVAFTQRSHLSLATVWVVLLGAV